MESSLAKMAERQIPAPTIVVLNFRTNTLCVSYCVCNGISHFTLGELQRSRVLNERLTTPVVQSNALLWPCPDTTATLPTHDTTKIHETQSYILFVPRRSNRWKAVIGSFLLNWSNSLIPTSLIPATSLLGGRFLYITITDSFQSSILGFLNELFPQLRKKIYTTWKLVHNLLTCKKYM